MKKKSYELTSANLTIAPENAADLWEGKWIIRMKNDPERIVGHATYAGEKVSGTVPIYVELEERFTNKGYGTEVFKEMVDFAFLHRNVYEVAADVEHENDKCIIALEKAGFVYRGKEGQIEHYSIIKPKTSWLGIYIFIGVVAGLALGIVLNSSWVGLGIGMVVSLLIGANMDAKANKERQSVVGTKEEK